MTSSQQAENESGLVDVTNKFELLMKQQADEEAELQAKILNKTPRSRGPQPTALSFNNSPGNVIIPSPELEHSLITF